MIGLTVNGSPFTDFMSASVTIALDTLSNDFSFTASAVSDFPPLKQGDAVKVTVDNETVLTGYIDEVSGMDAEGQHVITYTGRDRTGDFVDSQVGIINDLRTGNTLTLKKLIELTVSHLGQTLKVIDTVNPEPFSQTEDIVSPRIGTNAFEFVLKYAQKRQALLSSTPEGNILITQSSPTDSNGVVQSIRGAGDNNVLTQNWTIDASVRFNKYIHRGQLDPIALNFAGVSSSADVSDQSGVATDSDVRVGRQMVNVDGREGSLAYSSESLAQRAKWSKQLAKAKSIRYNCIVQGHQMPQGGLWTVNSLVQVNSDVADISRKMLVNAVTFSQGEGQPTMTSLEFVEKNVYTIDEKLTSSKKVGNGAGAFSSLG